MRIIIRSRRTISSNTIVRTWKKIGDPTRAFTLVALNLSLGAALVALSDEWRVLRARAELDQTVTLPILLMGEASNEISRALPPRAALIRALSLTRAADRTTNIDLRRLQIEAARRLLRVAMRGRPRWGEAQLVLTYIEFVDHGASAPLTRTAFNASYRYSPYLRGGASWRIGYAVGQWNSLDQHLKNAVANEAAWYSYQTDASYWDAMKLIVETPLELPFMQARALVASRALQSRANGLRE